MTAPLEEMPAIQESMLFSMPILGLKPRTTTTAASRRRKQKMNVYEVITHRFIESIEKGIIPWHKEWTKKGISPFPKNFHTGKAYRGINVFILWPD
ncbi:MAG: ArdC family protein, partial [Acidobacteriaceae bacterium]|nr:ArdC family protein [Acidobacteriaceae bacterium]